VFKVPCETDLCRKLSVQFGAISAAWEQVSELALEIRDHDVRAMVREHAIKQIANINMSDIVLALVDMDEALVAIKQSSADTMKEDGS
jgi:hypothetical protein